MERVIFSWAMSFVVVMFFTFVAWNKLVNVITQEIGILNEWKLVYLGLIEERTSFGAKV